MYTYTHVHILTHTQEYICMHAHMHTHVHTTYTHAHMCTHACIHIHTCTHIHIHTYKCTWLLEDFPWFITFHILQVTWGNPSFNTKFSFFSFFILNSFIDICVCMFMCDRTLSSGRQAQWQHCTLSHLKAWQAVDSTACEHLDPLGKRRHLPTCTQVWSWSLRKFCWK